MHKAEKKNGTTYSAIPISTFVEIISSQQDILTKKRVYSVKLFNGQDYAIHIFDSEILTSLGAKKLLQYGCVFNENRLKYLINYLSLSACKAPVKYVHSGLGWVLEKEPLFLSSAGISNSDVESEYIGNLDLKPKGSLEDWLNMVRKEVLGNDSLEFAIILGFASPILGYLNNFFDLGCFVFNFGNISSKGKTTTAMLIASTFSNPSFDRGLVTTFNSTNNAIIKFISQADGHPVVLDEVVTGNRHDFRKLLYQICSGTEKKRLNTDSSFKEIKTFGSIIITTAEFQIVDETATEGIKTRVFELDFDLTKSAEQADFIKKTIYSNYGQAGKAFLKFIIENKLNTLLCDYEDACKVLMKLYEKNKLVFGNLTSRIISKLAVIYITSKYVKECFKIEINIKGIVRKIIAIERAITKEMPLEDKAIDCIMQYVSMNKWKFIIENNDCISSIEGKIESKGYCKKIIILQTVVEKILKDNGFENTITLYKKWKEKNYIETEGKHNYSRVVLYKGLLRQKCIVFKASEFYDL